MSIQSTVHTDWKCSKNRSYAKTICRTSSPAESFAMLHFSHCEKENLIILMMRVRQRTTTLIIFDLKVKQAYCECGMGLRVFSPEESKAVQQQKKELGWIEKEI